MESPKILTGYSAVRVNPYIGVVRCGKCWGYGHTTTVCTTPQALCTKCGEAGHNKEDCTGRALTRIPCARRILRCAKSGTNSCPSVARAKQRLKGRFPPKKTTPPQQTQAKDSEPTPTENIT